MTASSRSPMAAASPGIPSSGFVLTDLSLDELRFLRSCDKRWFELSPVEAGAIIKAARELIHELIQEHDEHVAAAVAGKAPVEQNIRQRDQGFFG